MSLLSRLAVQAARAYGILSSKSTNVAASYLVVAGGGGAGSYYSGGGGAGGLLTSTTTLSTLNTYSITVGGGGAVGAAGYNRGTNGNDSILSGTGLTTVTATGGGGGAAGDVVSAPEKDGRSGGSGGGGGSLGGSSTGSGGTGTSGQGNNGGTGGTDGLTYRAGGGGGGASATGSNNTAGVGGAGGAGTASSISGSSVTYAGGGGGAGNTSDGAGGAGGGGGVNTSGTANRGGGGGGTRTGTAGSGGSGVVIISYTSATPKFVGGTLTTSGGNQIHTFTSSGTLSPLTPVTASYLVVAGGGAGNYQVGGGGGAGGLLASTTTLYSGATYTVTVGGGGASATANATYGTNGSDSILSGTGITTVTSTGGGCGGNGGGVGAVTGKNGGSGGGAGGNNSSSFSGGTGVSGQGFAGGSNGTPSPYPSGGGGGASAVGGNGSGSNSGAGGAGTASSISGSSVTYAGGGGGGGGYSAIGNSGGAGGGGAGATSGVGTAGTVNTGGGGGGGGGANAGGAGGSGVVIISYAGSQVFNGGLVTSSGGNTIHTFNATGALTPLTNNLNNSLRFRASASAYLSRTPTVAGNQKTWTWSAWIKPSRFASQQPLWNAYTSTTNYGLMSFSASSFYDSEDTFKFMTTVSNAVQCRMITTQVFRDPSAWYHIVVAIDTAQATAANRIKIYVNGSQVTAFNTATYPSQNADIAFFNTTTAQQIGALASGTYGYFDGYMTDINFIDGQALEPYYFGNNDAYGNWKPILYKGMYGTNGFYLPFGSSNFSLPISPTSGTGFATYAGYFLNGTSGTQANLPNNATNLAIGSGDFTLEGWVNTTTNGRGSLIGIGTVNSGGSLWFGWESDSASYVRFGATDVITTGLSLSSAGWVHIAVTRSGSTVRLYKNGSLVASGTSSTNLNLTDISAIGGYGASTPNSYTLQGYISNLRLVVGTALYTGSTYTVPTSALTAVSGTQLLTLQNPTLIDNSANNYTMTAVIPFALDASGNTNYWQMLNMNVSTAGVTYDAMTDVPTNTSATVANYAVMNPISNSAGTLSSANLKLGGTASGTVRCNSTMQVSSGKWYFEATLTTAGTFTTVGIGQGTITDQYPGQDALSYAQTLENASSINNDVQPSYGTSLTTGDIFMCAFDLDNNKIFFGKNGTWFASSNPVTGASPAYTLTAGSYGVISRPYSSGAVVDLNFGQRPFSYTAPTGYVALNTYNLPTPTILQGNKYMDATLYTGTGTSQVIVNQGQFKPDFVWQKPRSEVASHRLVDSVRGVNNVIYSNQTAAESAETNTLTAFNSNGFTGGGSNAVTSGNTAVAWQWQAGQGSTVSGTGTGGVTSVTYSANTTAGFSIVQYTETSSSGTATHGLGVAPSFIITKDLGGANNWNCYHVSLGATKRIQLNSTAAADVQAGVWNNTAPTSSVFTLGSSLATSGAQIAYCWAEIAGFSKFGSYTGNGSADGPFVYTGFRPKYIIVKQSSSAGNAWQVLDSSRNTYNKADNALFPNTTGAETTGNATFDFLSNGFKVRTADGTVNTSSSTYIYMAFAENPFKNANAR